MTQENTPLQKRAGANIGIEPGMGSPFRQDGGAKEKILSAVVGAESVILECPDRVARTPLAVGEAQGVIRNGSAADFNYQVFFRDELGNDCPLTGVVTITPGGFGDFGYHDGRLAETGFTLTPGQKIVLKTVAAPPPP